MSKAFMLVIADQRAVAWVIDHGAMAFPRRLRKHLAQLEAGDQLFLYATSRCFRPQQTGQFIGVATATSQVKSLARPLRIADRTFEIGCSLQIGSLVRLGEGLELAPLVSQLDAFPDSDGWRFSLMRSLVPLPAGDAAFVSEKLDPLLQEPATVQDDYLSRAGLPPR